MSGVIVEFEVIYPDSQSKLERYFPEKVEMTFPVQDKVFEHMVSLIKRDHRKVIEYFYCKYILPTYLDIETGTTSRSDKPDRFIAKKEIKVHLFEYMEGNNINSEYVKFFPNWNWYDFDNHNSTQSLFREKNIPFTRYTDNKIINDYLNVKFSTMKRHFFHILEKRGAMEMLGKDYRVGYLQSLCNKYEKILEDENEQLAFFPDGVFGSDININYQTAQNFTKDILGLLTMNLENFKENVFNEKTIEAELENPNSHQRLEVNISTSDLVSIIAGLKYSDVDIVSSSMTNTAITHFVNRNFLTGKGKKKEIPKKSYIQNSLTPKGISVSKKLPGKIRNLEIFLRNHLSEK